MKQQIRLSMGLSIAALVLAVLGGALGGAVAANLTVTSKQIRNGSVKSIDLKNNGVRTPDLANGTVSTADLKNDGVAAADLAPESVEGEALDVPPSQQCIQQAGSIPPTEVGAAFEQVDVVCAKPKAEASSALLVEWAGTASAGFSPCVFELRVDGQTAAGGGQQFIGNGTTTQASTSALFTGLPAGAHTIEVWAAATNNTNVEFPCSVGPAGTVDQTFIYEEQVG